MTFPHDISDADKAREEREARAATAKWLETQRGRPQYRAAPHARKAIARIMRPLSKKHGSGSTGLAQHWPDIIGARFAKFSRPLRFIGRDGDRALVLSAPGPAAALIMAASGSIIDRANTYLGPGHIQRLKIIQTKLKTDVSTGPAPRGLTQQAGDRLQSGLENIKDPDLKKAFESLGRQVLSKDIGQPKGQQAQNMQSKDNKGAETDVRRDRL